ncbi:MAG TPA: 4'-phosphopantetheinyl transferase superfamily protein [Pyrinomonadaceae bacterium]|nr:4'-phosphopantetheinyl transferase superfamily protein [Pyrinomonadaceae bacterium]
MTILESDRVKTMFTKSTQDWTPSSAEHEAFVLFAPVSPDPETSRLCSSILSDAELKRAERFLTLDGREHFLQRRAFRRHCGAIAVGTHEPLSQIVFEETEKGRPYLPASPDLWFSFSSCRFGFLGAWSSTQAIGVDLEDRTRMVEAIELADQFFSKPEAKMVERAVGAERLRTFFQLWCLKEAALKSIGEGLPAGLAAFEFELSPDLRIVNAPREHGEPEQFVAHLIENANTCAALVVRTLA